jgi:hypothetical protein
MNRLHDGRLASVFGNPACNFGNGYPCGGIFIAPAKIMYDYSF